MNWSVGISGDPVDLDMLAQRPLALGLAIVKDDSHYLLTSYEFDTIDDASIVKARAEQILSSLSGAIRLRLDARRSLSILSIQRSRPDGTREVFLFAEPIVCESRAFATLSVQRADGTVEVRSPVDGVGAWVDCRDAAMEKVLRLRSTGDAGWVELYRLLEVVEGDVGRESIVKSGWCKKRWLQLFRRTANSASAAGDDARHGTETTAPPTKPMDLAEARSGIDEILRRWLDHKAAIRSP